MHFKSFKKIIIIRPIVQSGLLLHEYCRFLTSERNGTAYKPISTAVKWPYLSNLL